MSEVIMIVGNDMLVVHDCLRHEFARLPITVKAVGEGNAERAAVVGGHVMLMATMLDSHHAAEDEIAWPVVVERSPGSAALITEMEAQHEALHPLVETARGQAQAWMASPGAQERAALHTTLIALEKELLHHLAVEEQQALPLLVDVMTQAEWASIGERSRADVTPEQLAIGLGLMLDDTTPERGEAFLASLPPETVAAFETLGRPAYAAYKARITDY